METSFILSDDEIFTLMSLAANRTEPGARFAREALPYAGMCDLSGLVEKKLARLVEGKLEIEPVIDMLADAIAQATAAERRDDAWQITSPWIALRCEKYIYKEAHWKITPESISL